MKKKIELLAPGGDVDAVKAAILAGADAVYCGLNKFNARNRATNLGFEELNGIIRLAHKHGCKVFLTLNILIMGSEVPDLFRLLNKLVNTGIDGVIVQDLGLFHLLSTCFKTLDIHASTQLNTHNEGQILFLKTLAATRVNLPRELNIDEIKTLTAFGRENSVLTEVFVHGSYCLSFSGLCYLSSVHGGNSGNRGRCSQPCRDPYALTSAGKRFPLNLKDNTAYSDLRELADAGVASLKIEGRIKKSDYVFTVVNCWRKQLQRLYEGERLSNDHDDLYQVFNRDFSNGYLRGDIHKDMFIDNPKDYSIKQFSLAGGASKLSKDKTAYYDEKDRINADLRERIKALSIADAPLTLDISGEAGLPLSVTVTTPDTSFTVQSGIRLSSKDAPGTPGLSHRVLTERLSNLANTGYYLREITTSRLQPDLFLPFKALSLIKKDIAAALTGSKEIIPPVEVPFLTKEKPLQKKPGLSVLISSLRDLHLYQGSSAAFFFQLPDCLKGRQSEFITLFRENRSLHPWFPSILIGEDYTAAVSLLDKTRPERVVTNNTGIAYAARERGIPWIAGPYLNIVNSFSLLCLKENFNCEGAFISNEISKHQIKRLIRPKDFSLYYSLYHPILLMTTRQCLFHQVTGCEKDRIDEDCILTCRKLSYVTNRRNEPLLIKKTRGNHHCLYNHVNFLNTDIVEDIPGMFAGFSIDLREMETGTGTRTDKTEIIRLFEQLLNGDPMAKERLNQAIHPTTQTQYKKGI